MLTTITCRLILTYLIPCHLLTTHTLPSETLLAPYPRLQKLFLPLCRCIKKGELHAFDVALLEGEDEFVKRRIYLTLERGRDIALRNLLRKVFFAGGYDEPREPGGPPIRRTRVPVAEFATAISLGSKETLDGDEVECLLANMIYKVCPDENFACLPFPSKGTARLALCGSFSFELVIGWKCGPFQPVGRGRRHLHCCLRSQGLRQEGLDA